MSRKLILVKHINGVEFVVDFFYIGSTMTKPYGSSEDVHATIRKSQQAFGTLNKNSRSNL